MAHEVRLDCFLLNISSRRKDKKTGEFKEYNFKEFFKENLLTGIEKDAFSKNGDKFPFKKFFEAYIQSFNDEFTVEKTSSKAFTLHTGEVDFDSETWTIKGLVHGGTVGVGMHIKDQKQAKKKAEFYVTKEHVHSIPYYFYIWLPKEGNTGLFVIQGLGQRSISGPFARHFKKFFNSLSKSLSMRIETYFSKKAEKNFRKRSTPDKFTIRQHHITGDAAEKMLGVEVEPGKSIDVEIIIKHASNIKKFGNKVSSFIDGKNTNFFSIDNVDLLDIKDETDVLVEYDLAGKKVTAKRSTGFELHVSHYVDEGDIERNIYNHPTKEALEKVVKDFVDRISQEENLDVEEKDNN